MKHGSACTENKWYQGINYHKEVEMCFKLNKKASGKIKVSVGTISTVLEIRELCFL